MFLTKESSLVQLAGAAEGTLQSSVVCVSVYACTYVCLLVVKAKPEMDSQMVKRNRFYSGTIARREKRPQYGSGISY